MSTPPWHANSFLDETKKSTDCGFPLRTTTGAGPKSVYASGISPSAVAIFAPATGRLNRRIVTVSPACNASANRRAVCSCKV
jgi:hypothetical protein